MSEMTNNTLQRKLHCTKCKALRAHDFIKTGGHRCAICQTQRSDCVSNCTSITTGEYPGTSHPKFEELGIHELNGHHFITIQAVVCSPTTTKMINLQPLHMDMIYPQWLNRDTFCLRDRNLALVKVTMEKGHYDERWGTVNKQRYYNLKEHWSEPNEPTRQPIHQAHYMSTAQVSKFICVSPSTIAALCNPKSRTYDRTFPKPRRVSKRSRVFLESEVMAWMEQRKFVHE